MSGILVTPDGRQWHGDEGESYRVGKGRRVAVARIEPPVLERLFADLGSPRAVQEIERRINALRGRAIDGAQHARIERKIAEIGRSVSRLVDIVSSVEDRTPYLRRVTELETERAALVDSLGAAKLQARQWASAEKIGPPEIRGMLAAMRADLVEKKDAGRVSEARAAIADIVDRIEYAEGGNAFTIRYRVTGVSLASPRGFEPRYSP